MSAEVNIVNQTQNGYAQIDVKPRSNSEPKHYIVPAQMAFKFQNDIKKHHSKMNTLANISLGASAFLGVLGASAFTKKFNNKITEWSANILAALMLIGISGHFVSKYEAQKYEEILKSNKAHEINVQA